MTNHFCDDRVRLHVRTFDQPPVWRHLEEVSISNCEAGIIEDLATVTENLTSLEVCDANLSGDDLQTIPVANAGMQVLHLNDPSDCFFPEDVRIIGKHGKNLRHIYFDYFPCLNENNLVDLVGEESKLCSLDIHGRNHALSEEGFRRLFAEKKPQYLGKGDGCIRVPGRAFMNALKISLPDRTWGSAGTF